ncbi:MAG: choice-of-anchor L domain-containing protein, partial [Myxococcales bacterium]|nr:choice-of-anchor L domain-containing protein [Myxococcales bacterium]
GDGASWSPCLGEVLPGNEDCANNIDDNCDGMIDEDIDADGDGFFACGGDCCDTKGAICQDPERVNPGAYEVPGNEVDDDCDGEEDEVEPTCDANLQTDAALAVEYARAMDLCQFTVEAPKKPEDWIWGVIDARFSLADGQGTPKSVARAIRPSFGDSIVAQGGAAMTVLSSGHAAATGDVKPAYAGFQPGVDHGLSSPPPADWFAANGGALPNPMGCPAPAVETANDPVMLTLRVRAPTNASSFSVDMFFFSAEYPEWVCSIYNDFFVALIDSDAPGNPEDLNIAIYDDGVDHWPVGVNLVKSVEGLFTACQNGVVGCLEKDIPESQYGGCAGAGALVGTGFDALDTGGCGDGKYVGGGTGWLKMRGNVVPGEVFELRLAIWDSGGHIFDSLVLLDGWEWSVEAAKPGLEPPE